jgi:ring-1,2-phenylacetyl-CoA epoxidase subunit PaaC
VDDLWRYTGELFMSDAIDEDVAGVGVGVDPSSLRAAWHAQVDDVLHRAGLKAPEGVFMQHGGRSGRHTEHLGHMLTEMQIVARSHPGAEW